MARVDRETRARSQEHVVRMRYLKWVETPGDNVRVVPFGIKSNERLISKSNAIKSIICRGITKEVRQGTVLGVAPSSCLPPNAVRADHWLSSRLP